MTMGHWLRKVSGWSVADTREDRDGIDRLNRGAWHPKAFGAKAMASRVFDAKAELQNSVCPTGLGSYLSVLGSFPVTVINTHTRSTQERKG